MNVKQFTQICVLIIRFLLKSSSFFFGPYMFEIDIYVIYFVNCYVPEI